MVFLWTMATGPVGADTPGYPGPTTTVAPAPTTHRQDEGALVAGTSTQFDDCGFTPGSAVAVTFNGQAAGSATADSSGCVHIPVVTGANGSVTVNGRAFAAQATGNEVTATGVGSNGAGRTFTNTFAVVLGGSAVRVGGVDRARLLPRTGVAILRWVLVASALVALGAGMVLAERRRLARRTT